jgi:hypothetical protein
MFQRISKKFAVPSLLMVLVGVAMAVPTVLTPQVLKENNYAVQAGDLTLTQTACDNVNGNSFAFTGRETLIVNNPDAAPHTFTLTSIADSLGRTGDIGPYSVAATTIAVIHLDTMPGWRQTNGTILLACNSNLLKFGVVRLPG